MSSSTKAFKSFMSFRSSTSNLDEKKHEEEYHEETVDCQDGICAEVSQESWYKVREESERERILCACVCVCVNVNQGSSFSLVM